MTNVLTFLRKHLFYVIIIAALAGILIFFVTQPNNDPTGYKGYLSKSGISKLNKKIEKAKNNVQSGDGNANREAGPVNPITKDDRAMLVFDENAEKNDKSSRNGSSSAPDKDTASALEQKNRDRKIYFIPSISNPDLGRLLLEEGDSVVELGTKNRVHTNVIDLFHYELDSSVSGAELIYTYSVDEAMAFTNIECYISPTRIVRAFIQVQGCTVSFGAKKDGKIPLLITPFEKIGDQSTYEVGYFEYVVDNGEHYLPFWKSGNIPPEVGYLVKE